MKKALFIVSIIAIVVIAGSLLYYFVFFRPGVEKAELRLQQQKAEEETLRKENLDKCLKSADDFFSGMMNSKGLSDEQVILTWKMHQDMIDNCYKQYGN